MPIDFAAALGFILISTYTPGPNNVSSAAMGALHGFRKTRNYLLGMTAGFFVVMLTCALASATVLHLFPGVETILRIVGAVYILYLAYGILKASYTFESENVKPMGFTSGFLLQVFNPKLIVYGLTLFSTFFAPIAEQPLYLVGTVIVLGLVALSSMIVWAAFGTVIKRYLRHPRATLALNIALSLFLVYTALDLFGIL
jgi:cysteine/O-acetylserine efflux protein